jgi:rod shape-determining protein MreC
MMRSQSIRLKNSLYLFVLAAFFVWWAHDRVMTYSFGVAEVVSSYVLYPVITFQKMVVDPIQSVMAKRRVRNRLYDDYQQLRNEHLALQADYIALLSSQNYADDVQEVVAYKKRYEQTSAVLVQVIARQLSNQSQSFIVDAGSNAGIEIDMVAVYKNCLIGRVVEVYPQYSKLIAITDVSCLVAGMCSQTKACGLYHGDNNLASATFSHVSHLAPIKVGDMVLSSGQGLIFPRGFGLGVIRSCKKEGLFYAITLDPLVDLMSINYCYLMKK